VRMGSRWKFLRIVSCPMTGFDMNRFHPSGYANSELEEARTVQMAKSNFQSGKSKSCLRFKAYTSAITELTCSVYTFKSSAGLNPVFLKSSISV
jgi:hypothetical protein